MNAVLRRAVEDYRRRRFLLAVNAGYAARRANATSRAADEAEMAAWDATLADGLSDEPWAPNRRPVPKRKSR